MRGMRKAELTYAIKLFIFDSKASSNIVTSTLIELTL